MPEKDGVPMVGKKAQCLICNEGLKIEQIRLILLRE